MNVNSLAIFMVVAALLFSGPGNCLADIRSGLLAYYQFDEGTGTTTADATGNGHTGTLNNSPSWVAGKRGSALHFVRASHTYVEAADDFADNLGNMTVAVWLRLYSGLAGGTAYTIVSKMSNSVTGAGWQLYIQGQCYWIFFTQDAGGNNWNFRYTNSGCISDNNWHNLGATLSGGVNGTITIYMDGTSQYIENSSSGTVASSSTAQKVRVGDDGDLSGYALEGEVDEVRIYNRALSSNDMMELYLATPRNGDFNFMLARREIHRYWYNAVHNINPFDRSKNTWLEFPRDNLFADTLVKNISIFSSEYCRTV